MVVMISMISTSVVLAATNKSPFNGTGYSNFIIPSGHEKDTIVNGIDVSVFQSRKGQDAVSNLNWSTVKSKGVDYAILRVGGTYAASLKYYGDETFKDHYNKAKKAGMGIGIYWLSQAMTESKAKEEAKKAVAALQSYGVGPENLQLPVYMDYEFVSGGKMNSSTLTRGKGTKAAKAFCKTIESYGYQSGIYASTSFYDKYIDASQLPKTTRLWVAQYYNRCEYTKHKFDMWQYSSSGKLTNMFIDSNNKVVDCNFMYLGDSSDASSDTDISNCKVVCDKSVKYLGSGKLHTPDVKVTSPSGTVLSEGKDYTLMYIKNTAKGTAKVYIQGLGKYSGYRVTSFKITGDEPTDGNLSVLGDSLSFASGSGYSKSGNDYIKGIAPETSISKFKSNIKLPSAYTVDVVNANHGKASGNIRTGWYVQFYKNNVLEASARIVVTGDVNKDGKCNEGDVELVAQNLVGLNTLDTIQKKAAAKGATKVQLKNLGILIGNASTAKTASLESEDSAEAVAESLETGESRAAAGSVSINKTQAFKGQNVYATISANSSKKHVAMLVDLSIGKGFNYSMVTEGKYFYNNGKLLVYALNGGKASCKYKLRSNTAGTHTVSFSGNAATADGSTFACEGNDKVKIISAKAPIISEIASGVKYLKVNWEKADKAPFTGYQIRYSTKSSMKSAKTVTVKSSKIFTKKVSRLTSGKKYYVQVRGYVNATTHSSAWSKSSSVTVK